MNGWRCGGDVPWRHVLLPRELLVRGQRRRSSAGLAGMFWAKMGMLRAGAQVSGSLLSPEPVTGPPTSGQQRASGTSAHQRASAGFPPISSHPSTARQTSHRTQAWPGQGLMTYGKYPGKMRKRPLETQQMPKSRILASSCRLLSMLLAFNWPLNAPL